MKIAVISLLLLSASGTHAGEYRVGAGDILAVKIQGHEELSGVYSVSPDKSISFPLIGQVGVGAMTLRTVNETLTSRLNDGFIKYPVITVALEKSNSRRCFIYGEVKSPGELILAAESTTVTQAISKAGGLTKAGSETTIRILRRDDKDARYRVVPVDLKRVYSEGLGDEFIENNDMIIVQQGWF